MLSAVNNLGILYQNQCKLIEAEKMFQRALQGNENALSVDNSMTYVRALNTAWAVKSLFECKAI